MKHGTAMQVMIPIRDASSAWREPTLDEILSDSIVEAVMQADSVDPKELRALLVRIAHTRRLTAGADCRDYDLAEAVRPKPWIGALRPCKPR